MKYKSNQYKCKTCKYCWKLNSKSYICTCDGVSTTYFEIIKQIKQFSQCKYEKKCSKYKSKQ